MNLQSGYRVSQPKQDATRNELNTSPPAAPPHDALIAALIREPGPACRPDLASTFQTAERYLRQAHSINEMVPIYRRLLAS